MTYDAYDDGQVRLVCADVLAGLATIPDASVQTVVTSPPYWALRDYGIDGQLGLEASPWQYLEDLVAIFREVWRVLAPDGTCWVNMGDTYASKARGNDAGWESSRLTNPGRQQKASSASLRRTGERHRGKAFGLREKSLIGMPWRFAIAMMDDGWILRSEVIWHKANLMPESVRDRPTRAHEQLFMFTKRPRYYYDAAAIREPASPNTHLRISQDRFWEQHGGPKDYGGEAGISRNRSARKALEDVARAWDRKRVTGLAGQAPRPMAPKTAAADGMTKNNPSWAEATTGLVLERNKRTVWTIGTQPFRGKHFATFPEALVEPCILAGSRIGDVVLDPFVGSGTTAVVARRLHRRAVGIDLNPEYLAMAIERLDSQLILPEWA